MSTWQEAIKCFLRKHGILYSASGLLAKDLAQQALELAQQAHELIRQTDDRQDALYLQTLRNTFALENRLITIEIADGDSANRDKAIENYWTGHTVRDAYIRSEAESLEAIRELFKTYPGLREYARMDDAHDNEVILDYGCGPGHDVAWFYTKSGAREIIGMDISLTALQLTQFRMAWHDAVSERLKLVKLDDSSTRIPLEDRTVDFVNCQGVLMHTSNPQAILKEFKRVLRPGKKACIMVYNKNSIWYHLYAAYQLKYIDASPLQELGETQTQISLRSDDDIFRCSTDGVFCPKADCYTPDEFTQMCQTAGFEKITYVGGYPNATEIGCAEKYLTAALQDERLDEVHKVFLRKVQLDASGVPIAEGKVACVSGVYWLQ